MNQQYGEADVRRFGAAGDGQTDDTGAVQTAFDAARAGGTVYFPAGTYRIARTVIVRQSGITVAGDGAASELVHTYEQKEGDTPATASLLSFAEGIRDVVVRDLKLSYSGPFFPNPGESYAGKVCGLFFPQCFDILVENLEATGFNGSGISLATGSPDKYARRFRVSRCRLHHNRVAGIAFGNVEQISITDCDLEHQGSPADGGTGYGCTGASYEIPRHVQILGNRAMYNTRKGIDLHAGIDAVIEGNLCHGNRLYGIYAEGPNTGDVVIRGNTISGMERESMGFAPPYTWIMGIGVGCFAKKPAAGGHFHFLIEGNLLTGFGIGDGDAFPFDLYPDFERGTVAIRNNVIDGGRISCLLHTDSAAGRESRPVLLDLSGNILTAGECTDIVADASCCEDVRLSDNTVMIGTAQRGGPFALLSAGSRCRMTGNRVELRNIRSLSRLEVETRGEPEAAVLSQGNIANGNFC